MKEYQYLEQEGERFVRDIDLNEYEKVSIRISRINKGMASHQEWGVKTR
jgi:hypothetical protein